MLIRLIIRELKDWLEFILGNIPGRTGFFIRNMPARDSLAMRRFLDKNEPGIDMKAWMTCPHCDETSEVRLPMGATFFWPDAQG